MNNYSTLSPLLSGKELAALMGYSGVTSTFRQWCKLMGIKSVPGRVDKYDPKHVRDRLDIMQNIKSVENSQIAMTEPSLTEQRRLRRAA